MKEITGSSDNKKATGLLYLIATADFDFLDWSEVDFRELVNAVFNFKDDDDSKDNNAIDALADLLREKKSEIKDPEKKELIEDALKHIMLLVLESEMGIKFPGITMKISNRVRGV